MRAEAGGKIEALKKRSTVSADISDDLSPIDHQFWRQTVNSASIACNEENSPSWSRKRLVTMLRDHTSSLQSIFSCCGDAAMFIFTPPGKDSVGSQMALLTFPRKKRLCPLHLLWHKRTYCSNTPQNFQILHPQLILKLSSFHSKYVDLAHFLP